MYDIHSHIYECVSTNITSLKSQYGILLDIYLLRRKMYNVNHIQPSRGYHYQHLSSESGNYCMYSAFRIHKLLGREYTKNTLVMPVYYRQRERMNEWARERMSYCEAEGRRGQIHSIRRTRLRRNKRGKRQTHYCLLSVSFAVKRL